MDKVEEAARNARAVLRGLIDAPIGTAMASVMLAYKLLDDALDDSKSQTQLPERQE